MHGARADLSQGLCSSSSTLLMPRLQALQSLCCALTGPALIPDQRKAFLDLRI